MSLYGDQKIFLLRAVEHIKVLLLQEKSDVSSMIDVSSMKHI